MSFAFKKVHKDCTVSKDISASAKGSTFPASKLPAFFKKATSNQERFKLSLSALSVLKNGHEVDIASFIVWLCIVTLYLLNLLFHLKKKNIFRILPNCVYFEILWMIFNWTYDMLAVICFFKFIFRVELWLFKLNNVNFIKLKKAVCSMHSK